MVVTLLFGNYLLKNVVPNLSATLLSASFSLSTCVLLSFAQLVSESQNLQCARHWKQSHITGFVPLWVTNGTCVSSAQSVPDMASSLIPPHNPRRGCSHPPYTDGENEAGSKCTRSRGWYMVQQDCKPRELTLAPHPSNISPGGFQGK